MARSMRVLAALWAVAMVAAPQLEAQRERPARERVEVRRGGWIGISYETTESGTGMVIERVIPGSPAAEAGLTPGDTVVRWNGSAEPAGAVSRSRLQPGDTVRLRVRREGRERDVTVVAASRRGRMGHVPGRDHGRAVVILDPAHVAMLRIHADSLAVHADSLHRRLRVMLQDSLGPAIRRFERVEAPRIRVELERAGRGLARSFEVGERSVAGAEFTELNAGLASYFGAERGALVLRVAPETPAARAGLEPGDVIVAANGHPIEQVRELREAIVRAPDRTVEMDVVRRGTRQSLRLRWE